MNGRRHRWPYALAIVAVAVLAIPTSALAGALSGANAPSSELLAGVWWFKLLFLANAVLIVVLSRVGLTAGAAASSDPNPRSHRGFILAIAGLVAVGLALRLYELGNGLWFDEIQTLVWYVRRPIEQIVSTFDTQNQHVLYSVFARASVVTFGESAATLRLPAALLGATSLWACYWFGVQITSRREAILAAAFLTFSYHHVWFSQNARGYTGLLLGTLIATTAFLKLLDRPTSRPWMWVSVYAGAMALTVYTHVTGAFVAVGHAAALAGAMWQRRDRGLSLNEPGLVGLLLAAALSLQLYALVLPQFMNTLTGSTVPVVQSEWKNPLWFVTEAVRGLARGIPGGVVTVLGGLIVATAGVWSFFRRDRKIAAVMIVPGLLLGTALLVMGHNLWPRFFFFAAGFAALIVMRGLHALAELVRQPKLGTAAAILMIVGSAATVPTAWNPKQDYESASAFVDREHRPNDAVVTVDLTTLPYQAYYLRVWPAITSVDDLRRIESKHDTTWLLYTFPPSFSSVYPDIWQYVTNQYEEVARFGGTLSGGEIVVVRR